MRTNGAIFTTPSTLRRTSLAVSAAPEPESEQEPGPVRTRARAVPGLSAVAFSLGHPRTSPVPWSADLTAAGPSPLPLREQHGQASTAGTHLRSRSATRTNRRVELRAGQSRGWSSVMSRVSRAANAVGALGVLVERMRRLCTCGTRALLHQPVTRERRGNTVAVVHKHARTIWKVEDWEHGQDPGDLSTADFFADDEKRIKHGTQ